MKKYLFLGAVIILGLGALAAIAKDQPAGEPFSAIWLTINGLQNQAGDVEGRIASLGNAIVNLENKMVDLEKEIDDLKEGGGNGCVPEPEICDTVDNDCDDQIDEVCSPIFKDDFNSYFNGSVVGQGNWQNYVLGSNFIIQGSLVHGEAGGKALANSFSGDSVIIKPGNSIASGRQVFWLVAQKNSWAADSFFQIRLSKGPWDSAGSDSSFAAVNFEQNGQVGYFKSGSELVYFDNYTDYSWNKLEVEWRSFDNKARYRVNNNSWTNWDTFANSENFADFDYVGFDFYKTGGSGAIYIDDIQ